MLPHVTSRNNTTTAPTGNFDYETESPMIQFIKNLALTVKSIAVNKAQDKLMKSRCKAFAKKVRRWGYEAICTSMHELQRTSAEKINIVCSRNLLHEDVAELCEASNKSQIRFTFKGRKKRFSKVYLNTILMHWKNKALFDCLETVKKTLELSKKIISLLERDKKLDGYEKAQAAFQRFLIDAKSLLIGMERHKIALDDVNVIKTILQIENDNIGPDAQAPAPVKLTFELGVKPKLN